MNLERYALYPHQLAGVEFLASRGRAILGDDMGLGKTRQAIVAMKESSPDGVFLVICPASLKLNWARELSLVDPTPRIEVLGVAGYEHLQCTFPGFEHRGECKHVRDVRKTALTD